MAVPSTSTYVKDVNTSALEETLRDATFVAKYNGIVVDTGTTPDTVTVYANDALTAGEQTELDAIIADHNPATPSLEQQIETASKVETITADYVIDVPRDLILYLNHSVPITVTMPAVHNGESVTIKDISNAIVDTDGVLQNPVTLLTQDAQTIDGQSTFVVDRNLMSVTLRSDSTNFQIL